MGEARTMKFFPSSYNSGDNITIKFYKFVSFQNE